jgi:hypothetical protein
MTVSLGDFLSKFIRLGRGAMTKSPVKRERGSGWSVLSGRIDWTSTEGVGLMLRGTFREAPQILVSCSYKLSIFCVSIIYQYILENTQLT